MLDEFFNVRLNEIALNTDRAFAMGPFGSNIRAENYQDSGIPVIRGINIGQPGEPRFIANNYVYLSESKANELSSSNAYPNDIVFVAQGTVGKVGIIPTNTNNNRFVLSQNLMKVTIDPDRADPLYVFYFFRSTLGQHEILCRVNPTGVPCISKPLSSLREFNVKLPSDINAQRAIASILSTLDDKIELNRKMNRTLEAMAQVIFKSWFVDFDPVRAKAEGQDPGLPKKIADLFPDSFENSELGEIPEGWQVKSFADTVEIIGGGTPKTTVPEYWDGDIPWFSVVDAPSDSEMWVLDTKKKITQEGVRKSSTQILTVGTTIISARGTVGRVALVGTPMAMNQSCYGLHGKADKYGSFTYFVTRALVADLQQHAHGSVFDTITRDTLAGVLVMKPYANLIQAFEIYVNPIMERVRSALLETRNLADLLSVLLPKLISGEIQVSDIERIVRRFS